MTDFAKLKTVLEDKLESLTARLEEIDDDLSKAGDDDWEEHAAETADDEVLEKVGNVALDEVRAIKFALSRLDEGTYGTCVRCRGSIAPERLEALPYATKCMNCS